MRNIFNYDLLMNPVYRHRFLYVPVGYPSRLNRIALQNYDIVENNGVKELKLSDDQTDPIYKTKEIFDRSEGTRVAANCQSNYVRLIVDLAYLYNGKAMTLTTLELAKRALRKQDEE